MQNHFNIIGPELLNERKGKLKRMYLLKKMCYLFLGGNVLFWNDFIIYTFNYTYILYVSIINDLRYLLHITVVHTYTSCGHEIVYRGDGCSLMSLRFWQEVINNLTRKRSGYYCWYLSYQKSLICASSMVELVLLYL